MATVFAYQPRAVSGDTTAVAGQTQVVGDIAGHAMSANGDLIRYRKRAAIALASAVSHIASTKLSMTFLLPAFSKAISSLLPSIATMQP